MNMNKRKSIISIFVAGTLLFGSVAIADIVIGDGYNGAKQAIKHTSNQLAYNTDSFSSNVNYEIKYDGQTVESASNEIKYDIKNKRTEEKNTGDNRADYYYSDTEKIIYKHSDDEMYYRTDRKDDDVASFEDPFEEDIAKDVERVVDAFVSNMKDFVQVSDSETGGKVYFGSLDSTQMPAFANALASVFMKYSLIEDANRRGEFPEISDNIYLKEASGKLSQSADGMIDSGVCSVIFIGNDKEGAEHTFEISVGFNICDINSTVVEEPKIAADKITITQTHSDTSNFDQKDIMTFKSDIVETADGAYKKVGERVLTITGVEGDTVKAHLCITGTDNDINTDIIAVKSDEDRWYMFEYADKNGTQTGAFAKTYYGERSGGYMLELQMGVKIKENNHGEKYMSSATEFVNLSMSFE